MGDKLTVNPWLSIWVRPRQTIRAIIQYNSSYLFSLLCLIYGFPVLLQVAQNLGLGDRFSSGAIILGCLVLAVVPGYIMINLAAGLFYWTGKWIGGIGTFQNIRGAVAWSNVPSLVNTLIWIVNIAMFGKRIFSVGFFAMPLLGGEFALIVLMSFIQLALAIWAFIILLNVLGEAQGFSTWKGLLNVLIPFFVIFVGVSLLMWFLTLITGGSQV